MQTDVSVDSFEFLTTISQKTLYISNSENILSEESSQKLKNIGSTDCKTATYIVSNKPRKLKHFCKFSPRLRPKPPTALFAPPKPSVRSGQTLRLLRRKKAPRSFGCEEAGDREKFQIIRFDFSKRIINETERRRDNKGQKKKIRVTFFGEKGAEMKKNDYLCGVFASTES